MERREFTAAGLGLGVLWGVPGAARARVVAGTVQGAATGAPAEAEVGVRAALERAAVAAVAQLGRPDGFLGDAQVRIGLPPALEKVARLLRATGRGPQLDELVTAMNRAAEAAVPLAKPVVVDAVRTLGVDDAWRIVRGGPTSATEYFAGRTRTPLTERFLPIVTRATERLALARRYNALAGQAATLGLVKPEQGDLQRHVTARALDGLYGVIGRHEQGIRADPVGTGSALLRRVFGR